jgi:ligand-binding sensor domain-containing protein/two-component sensor histidine kinase
MFAVDRNMRSILVAFLMLLPAPAAAERLPLKAYTVADGLPNNNINKIVRDSRGFLWFCTNEGLSRFDGYSFTNYGLDQGLPHSAVNDFLETRSGEMWVATNGGLVRFDPQGAPSHEVVLADQKARSAPMFTVIVPDDEDRAARAVNSIVEDRNGTIWCGTMKHLYRVERRGSNYSLAAVDLGTKEDFITDLLPDRGGSLWIASFKGLYCRRADGRLEHFTRRDGLPDDTIHDLLEDHQGRLWAATRSGGFFRFNPERAANESFVSEVHNKQNGLTTDWVFQLFETSDQQIWVATNQGVVEFFPEAAKPEARFRVYTPRNGLTFREVTALNEDVNGNLWLGTNVTGAMKLERHGFLTWDEQDGIVGGNAIFGDRAGETCFRAFVHAGSSEAAKTQQMLGSYDEKGFHWFMPNTLATSGWVFEEVTLQARNGQWWIGTGSGLYRFPATENFEQTKRAHPSIYTTADGLASMQVFRLFEDSRGAIWVSTIGAPNGLARIAGPNFLLEDLSNAAGLPSPKDDLARAFGEDAGGNIWIGFGSGVARFRSGNITFYTTNEGLPAGGIQSIFSDHAGRLWLGSLRSGLIRIDHPEAERPIFVNYATAQGLSSNSTEAITEDLQGRIYVGTGRGLDQLDPLTGHIKHFSTFDGLATGAMNAAFCDHGGALWFSTQKGLSRFVPESSTSSPAPPIVINGLRVMGGAQHVSAVGEREMALADLHSGQNQIQIDFVGLSFAVGDVLRYQYKLEGSGADWSAPTDQRTVNFASLSPGHYRFLVRALNSDGLTSAQPAVVSFTILPPIWARWWFLPAALVLFMLAIYALYRYRVARLLELERVRTRIASDLHDDIGSNLSLIAGLSEMLRQQARQVDSQIADRLGVIANASRQSVEAMGDIVWAVNPKRDNVVDLAHRMRRFANDSLTPRNIEFHLDAPTPNQNVRVNTEVRREVLLVFKEAINNVARHSGCRNASAALKIERGRLVLIVSDDGHGFDEARIDHGHGLESMRRRAEKLGGKIEMSSRDGEGTTVSLTAPVSGPGW